MSQSDRPEVGGKERERWRIEEIMHGKRENGEQATRETKGQKARERLVLASCMDFELAACMFLPIPWCPSPVLSKPR